MCVLSNESIECVNVNAIYDTGFSAMKEATSELTLVNFSLKSLYTESLIKHGLFMRLFIDINSTKIIKYCVRYIFMTDKMNNIFLKC